MSDDSDPLSPGAAEALLARIRKLKDEFREVDATVAADYRVVLEARAEHARHRMANRGMFLGGVLYPGQAVGEALLHYATDIQWWMSLLPQSYTSPTAIVLGGAVGAGIGAVTGWHTRNPDMDDQETLSRAFLEAGVAVELALGGLRTALDLERRGIAGSTEALATSVNQASHAFKDYINALSDLNVGDLAARIPLPDPDIQAAKRLFLNDDISNPLYQARERAALAGAAPTQPIASGPGPLGTSTSAASTSAVDHLSAVIATADELRTTLVTADGALDDVAGTILHLARHEQNPDRVPTLWEIEYEIGKIRAAGDQVESASARLQEAARNAQRAPTVPHALAILEEATPRPEMYTAFAGYPAGLKALLATIGNTVGDDRKLREAGMKLANLLERHVPQLILTIDTLTASFDDGLQSIRQL